MNPLTRLCKNPKSSRRLAQGFGFLDRHWLSPPEVVFGLIDPSDKASGAHSGTEQDPYPSRYFFSSQPASFSMLCTRQYSLHCVPTFLLPRSVNRFSRLLCRMLPNTGSTVPMRWL